MKYPSKLDLGNESTVQFSTRKSLQSNWWLIFVEAQYQPPLQACSDLGAAKKDEWHWWSSLPFSLIVRWDPDIPHNEEWCILLSRALMDVKQHTGWLKMTEHCCHLIHFPPVTLVASNKFSSPSENPYSCHPTRHLRDDTAPRHFECSQVLPSARLLHEILTQEKKARLLSYHNLIIL